MVSLEGHQLVGLVAFHHAVKFDALHHVREGVQNLVTPRKGGGEVDAADFSRLAKGEFPHHAVDVEGPDGEVLLALVQDGVVRGDEGGLAVLAVVALASVAMPVPEDVDGAAPRADEDGALLREEGVKGRGQGLRRLGLGGGVQPFQKGGFLVGVRVGEQLAEDFKLGGCDCHTPIIPRGRTDFTPLLEQSLCLMERVGNTHQILRLMVFITKLRTT